MKTRYYIISYVTNDVMTQNHFFLKSTHKARHFGVGMVQIGSEITEIKIEMYNNVRQ